MIVREAKELFWQGRKGTISGTHCNSLKKILADPVSPSLRCLSVYFSNMFSG